MLRVSALFFAMFVQAALASAQNPPAAPSGPSTPAEASGVQQPVVQPPPPQTPAQPATIQPSPAPPLARPAPPPAAPPIVGSPTLAAPGAPGTPGADTNASAAGAAPGIGAVPAPVPLLPAGTITPERAASAATLLQRATELLDKSMGSQAPGALDKSGKVSVDRATLDEIRAEIGQVMSMLK